MRRGRNRKLPPHVEQARSKLIRIGQKVEMMHIVRHASRGGGIELYLSLLHAQQCLGNASVANFIRYQGRSGQELWETYTVFRETYRRRDNPAKKPDFDWYILSVTDPDFFETLFEKTPEDAPA